MSQINFNLTLSIDETKDFIKVMADQITPVVVSEPGVGKSTILKTLQAEMGDEYDYIYVDCPVKDMMDVAASIPNHDTKSLEYYVSDLFKINNGRKKVIMLDEFMKAPKLLQIIFTRLMLERTVGDVPLPEGSLLFGTSNNASDGVGDNMLAHAGNRVTIINMRKPNHMEWNVWATNNGIARPIRAWASMNTKAFKSYKDPDQKDNEYIFQPSSTSKQFVSPRSLAKASTIVNRRDKITDNALMVGLAGTIGEAGARSMSAFIALEGKLTTFADVMKNASTVKVPDDVSALVMMMFEAVDNIQTQDDLNTYMEFVNRIKNAEIQSIFFTMIMHTRPKIARYNDAINKWTVSNHKLM
jgi:rubrerythrin